MSHYRCQADEQLVYIVLILLGQVSAMKHLNWTILILPNIRLTYIYSFRAVLQYSSMPHHLDVNSQCRAPVWTNTCLPYFIGSFNFIQTPVLSSQILLLAAVKAKVAIKRWIGPCWWCQAAGSQKRWVVDRLNVWYFLSNMEGRLTMEGEWRACE